MRYFFVFLLSAVLLSTGAAPESALALGFAPNLADQSIIPAQQDDPTGEMGHEPWEGTNWGLVAALVFTVILLLTVIVLVSRILSWPHRSR